MYKILILLILAQVLVIQSVHISPTRVKRGIFGEVTKTVFKTIVEKHYVPASCVHVSADLPDCRNVRFMNYPNFDSNSFKLFNFANGLLPTITTNEAVAKETNTIGPNDRADNELNGTVHIQGWGEYLGFYRPTVTVTELKIEPTTVADPRIMVTYDIRGCKPHELPHDLAKCPEDNSLELAEILPTSTVHAAIKPTTLPKLRMLPEEVQGSETQIGQEDFHSPTRKL